MDKDVIYVRIDENIKKELDMIALNENRSLNNLIVTILMKYVDKKRLEESKEKDDN